MAGRLAGPATLHAKAVTQLPHGWIPHILAEFFLSSSFPDTANISAAATTHVRCLRKVPTSRSPFLSIFNSPTICSLHEPNVIKPWPDKALKTNSKQVASSTLLHLLLVRSFYIFFLNTNPVPVWVSLHLPAAIRSVIPQIPRLDHTKWGQRFPIIDSP